MQLILTFNILMIFNCIDCDMFDSCKEPVGIEYGFDVCEDVSGWDLKHIETPRLPLVEKIPSGLYHGRTIDFEAQTHTHKPYEFAVNLCVDLSPDSDVLFHFNPRFDRRIVVRNHKRRGSWGEEEIAVENSFPFRDDRGFRMRFFISDTNVLVSVDNKHFCSFAHRLPLDTVKYLTVRGDINLQAVHIRNSDTHPAITKQRLPIMISSQRPKVKRKLRVIRPGSVVTIEGRVKLLPQQFYVNLQCSSTILPHSVIPLHVNLRLCQQGYLEHQMIFNSWINGGWGREEKPEECPFLPGMAFTMKIIYLSEGFHVSVNDKYLMAFPLRLSPPPDMDTVLVHGDVITKAIKVTSSNLQSVMN